MKKILLILSFAVSSLSMGAQVKVWIENTCAIAGDTMMAKIITSDFDVIGAFQFSLKWDTCAVHFIHLQSLNKDLSLTQEGNFNADTEFTDKGQLIVLWYDNTGLGQTLPDSSVLFGLDFLVIGELGSIFTIGFSDEPTSILFWDVNGQIAPDTMGVKLEISPCVSALKTLPFHSFTAYPNPAVDYLIVECVCIKPEDLNLELINEKGRIISSTRFNKVQEIKLQYSLDQLLPGMYFIQLKSTRGGLVRKVVKVAR